MKKVISLLLIVALLLVGVVACDSSDKPEPSGSASEPVKTEGESTKPEEKPVSLKIGLMLPGIINDGGWNTMAYEALMAAKEAFGAEVSYTEMVSQNDQVSVARQYVEEGFNVIIGHGFEFGDSLTQVAGEFPDTYFINYGGGVKNGKNLASVQYAYGECGALAGVLIGMSEEISKVSVIMAMENPTGMQEMKNTELTALKYNPDIEFTYSFTGDWNDVALAKEAALASIAAGADVVISDLSGPIDGIVQACQDLDAMYFVVTFDGYDKDPSRVLGSSVHDATKATLAALQLIVDGTFTGDIFAFGIESGVMYMGKYGPTVTDEMIAEVEKVQAEIVAGDYELLILVD